MANIDDFDAIVGIVFSKLYGEFPIPTTIESLPVVIEAMDEVREWTDEEMSRLHERRLHGMDLPEEFSASEKRASLLFEIFEAAMDWLSAEGFLRTNGHGAGLHYLDTVLTLKGLQALSVVPAGVQSPLGQQMLNEAKKGSLEGLRDLAKRAVADWGPTLISLAIQSAKGQ